MSKRLFISCVSDEFKPLREDLRFYLTRAGCEVHVQEEFRQTPEAARHANHQTHIDRLKLGRRYAEPVTDNTDLLGKAFADLAEIVRIEKVER